VLSAELGLHDLPAAQHAPRLLFQLVWKRIVEHVPGRSGDAASGHAFESAPALNWLLPFRLRPPSPSGLAIDPRPI
jgi:hypothetical protein